MLLIATRMFNYIIAKVDLKVFFSFSIISCFCVHNANYYIGIISLVKNYSADVKNSNTDKER